jgi:hypothetical protein
MFTMAAKRKGDFLQIEGVGETVNSKRELSHLKLQSVGEGSSIIVNRLVKRDGSLGVHEKPRDRSWGNAGP